MGVSLQVYRIRIGSFKQVTKSRLTRSRESLNPPHIKFSLCMLVLILSLSIPLKMLSIIATCGPPCPSATCTPSLSLTLIQPSFSNYGAHSLTMLSPPPGTSMTSSTSPGRFSANFTPLQRPGKLPTNTQQGPFPTSSIHCNNYHLCPHLEAPSSWLSSKERNSLAKAKFGNINRGGKGIKCAVWNKGNSLLQNKHLEIERIIGEYHPHILGLCEANLKNNVDLGLVQHQDYKIHISKSITNPEIGLARAVVYTHSSLVVKRREDLEDEVISSVWLEAGLPRQRKIIVATFYREWQQPGNADQSSKSIQDQLERWCRFLTQWEAALSEGKEVIVMGDINLDFLKWTRTDLTPTDSTLRLKPLTEALFSRIFPHGVSQLVKVATRVWPGLADSGLDHIYSNRPEKCSDITAELTGRSDHKLLKFTRFTKSLNRKVKYVRKRSFKNFDPKQFIEAVRNISWFDIYMCQDPSTATELLTKKLTDLLDSMAPIRTIQVRSKYAAWLSEQTKALLKQRDSAQVVAASSGSQDDWRNYKNLRNSATARMRREKKAWEMQKLDSAQHSSSILWKNVKSWLNWGDSGPPSKLFFNGEMITKPPRIATIMNNFFISKVENLKARIPASDSDPLEKLREVVKNRECTFTFRPVTPKEIGDIIAGLKNTKSTGIDFINTWVIKLIAEEVVPALTHIVNLSILQAEFPQSWKQSKVVPLLKKGDPILPQNYRPVSLLPIFSKVLERAVFLQVVSYLESNQLLNPNHHGCRHGHNTATALLQMFDQWLDEVNKDLMVGVMLVDLSAAFDMVDHATLIEKLELYGLDHQALNWMNSYVSGKSQVVMVDGSISPAQSIPCVVPQGSIHQ